MKVCGIKRICAAWSILHLKREPLKYLKTMDEKYPFICQIVKVMLNEERSELLNGHVLRLSFHVSDYFGVEKVMIGEYLRELCKDNQIILEKLLNSELC